MQDDLYKAYLLIPVIKEYSWGSLENIQKITGKTEEIGKPAAELWMGSHPNGESRIVLDSNETVLMSQFIKSNPEFILGSRTCDEFNKSLPFLFKILSADKPLSIQAHPDKRQAEEGFSVENRKKITLNSFNRNYRDDNHKPELMYALTDFTMMKGFRNFKCIKEDIQQYCPDTGKNLTAGCSTIEKLFSRLFDIDEILLKRIISEAALNAGDDTNKKSPVSSLILLFNNLYNTDPGILSPLFLNIFTLKSEEAVFIPAGELHAYIHGTGFELMANSDNVLRGGLTEKNVDSNELLKILSYKPSGDSRIVPDLLRSEKIFNPGVKEFLFSEITLSEKSSYHSAVAGSIEIFFCLKGSCTAEIKKSNFSLNVKQGECFVIPANAVPYEIKGKAKIYKAAVNV